MRMAHEKKIAVIGAGIIGLATAVRLQESLGREWDFTLFTKTLPGGTTSDGAAGLWEPSSYSDTPDENIRSWSKRTWDFLLTFLANPQHPEIGVYYIPGYELFREESFETPCWADIFASYHVLERDEAQGLCPGAQSGYMMTSLMAEGQRMVDYMFRRFISRGGKCVVKKIASFDELALQGFRLIANCSGIGARQLCSDEQVFPIRGQIVMVHAPWIRMALGFGDHYIIPKQDYVVLGGTKQVGDWCEEVRVEDSRAIIEGCCALDPGLETAPVVREWAGLRPGRTEVRVEVEEKRTPSGLGYTVVHNYGHGGSGLTLFWGCAEDASLLAVRALGELQLHRL